MTRAVLGLGSNLGDRWETLDNAVSALREDDADLVVSSIYETAPVGGPSGQGPFLNCVVVMDWNATPEDLLARCVDLERLASRVRVERWGPRTLDVDVLWIDGYESNDPTLTVPHPRMFERAFVLVPLEEVAPDIVDPTWRDRRGVGGAADDDVRKVGVLISTRRNPA